jgi:death on curing protein
MYHFLTAEDVIADQDVLLGLYGGGLPGLLNQGQLESAVHQPQSGFCAAYFHNDVYEMAAAYLEHLVLAHAFLNANKRIALSSALRFLFVNGVRINATDRELIALVVDTATHDVDDQQITQFFRDRAEEIAGFQLAGNDASRSAALLQATAWVQRTYGGAFEKLADM